MKIRESAEDYLEAILVIFERKGSVRSIDIANELEFSKPSVSIAMKNLRENGYITIDFNTYELEMHYLPTDSCYCYKMALKEEYALPDRKYTVQLDMAERCFNENTPPCMIDGIDLQIESLEWLFAQKRI